VGSRQRLLHFASTVQINVAHRHASLGTAHGTLVPLWRSLSLWWQQTVDRHVERGVLMSGHAGIAADFESARRLS
jgi:hypothetical protein